MNYKKEIKKEINNEYYNEQLKMRREYKTIKYNNENEIQEGKNNDTKISKEKVH